MLRLWLQLTNVLQPHKRHTPLSRPFGVCVCVFVFVCVWCMVGKGIFVGDHISILSLGAFIAKQRHGWGVDLLVWVETNFTHVFTHLSTLLLIVNSAATFATHLCKFCPAPIPLKLTCSHRAVTWQGPFEQGCKLTDFLGEFGEFSFCPFFSR